MKTELLWDPCLDIVGHRIPNVFVKRYGDDSHAQIEAIRLLAQGLGRHEGILIFPEGTRFTRAKQHALLERLRSKGDALYESAMKLRSVLPPRLGGTLAIVETARHADAVFCAHSGLESAVTLRDLLSGGLVGQCVRVRFWFVPAEQIPRDRKAMRRWFLEQWAKLDRLVTALNQEPGHA
jgi:1-acyl-sn-glycerol-3-phosphate acyltransferase